MEAGADAGAGPEGGLVLRVEDLDGSLLSDPVAHLVGRETKSVLLRIHYQKRLVISLSYSNDSGHIAVEDFVLLRIHFDLSICNHVIALH